MPCCASGAAGANGGGRPPPRPLLRPSPSANLAGKGKGDPLRREVRVITVVPQCSAAGVRRIKTTDMSDNSLMRAMKNFFIGRERELTDRGLFHKLSLVALLAWVGLGADGLSSSCYGPEEAYKVLLAHPPLALFVALMTAATVMIICASYSQIIALFPAGGGGYLVASRLLSPTAGVVSGSALLIDYVLTISVSVASGMDALFSFLPAAWLSWKLAASVGGILFLTMLNLRGVRESVLLLVPVFGLFLITHTFAVLYVFGAHAGALATLAGDSMNGRARRLGRSGNVGGGCVAPARLQHGRGHVHGNRGGEQRPADPARAPGARPAGARWCSWRFRLVEWSPACSLLICWSECARSREKLSTPCSSDSFPPAGRRGWPAHL